jgi:hypothetical protein
MDRFVLSGAAELLKTVLKTLEPWLVLHPLAGLAGKYNSWSFFRCRATALPKSPGAPAGNGAEKEQPSGRMSGGRNSGFYFRPSCAPRFFFK